MNASSGQLLLQHLLANSLDGPYRNCYDLTLERGAPFSNHYFGTSFHKQMQWALMCRVQSQTGEELSECSLLLLHESTSLYRLQLRGLHFLYMLESRLPFSAVRLRAWTGCELRWSAAGSCREVTVSILLFLRGTNKCCWFLSGGGISWLWRTGCLEHD